MCSGTMSCLASASRSQWLRVSQMKLDNHGDATIGGQSSISNILIPEVHVSLSYIHDTQCHNDGRVLSPRHNPITSPVSPTHSLTPFTAAFAMPDCVLLRLCRVLPVTLLSPPVPTIPCCGSCPALMKLLPCPVAYSEPMLGSTFSPALKLTKSENGTSQTCNPKNEAISVNDGMAGWS